MDAIYERWENGVQVDTSNAMKYCKYCGKPYAWDGKSSNCQCGVTPLNKFDYHAIMERLDKIEGMLNATKTTD